jgi:hypothetical protein
MSIQLNASKRLNSKVTAAVGDTEFAKAHFLTLAALLGIKGKVKPGDGEAVTSDFYMEINPKAVPKILAVLKLLKYEIEDQREDDGYINATSATCSLTLQFDNFKDGDCILVASM